MKTVNTPKTTELNNQETRSLLVKELHILLDKWADKFLQAQASYVHPALPNPGHSFFEFAREIHWLERATSDEAMKRTVSPFYNPNHEKSTPRPEKPHPGTFLKPGECGSPYTRKAIEDVFNLDKLHVLARICREMEEFRSETRELFYNVDTFQRGWKKKTCSVLHHGWGGPLAKGMLEAVIYSERLIAQGKGEVALDTFVDAMEALVANHIVPVEDRMEAMRDAFL